MSYAETLVRKTMDKQDLAKKIQEDEDYVRCPKCNNSLLKFLAKNGDGVDNNVIARILMISEEKVEEIYQEAVKKLQAEMVEKNE